MLMKHKKLIIKNAIIATPTELSTLNAQKLSHRPLQLFHIS